MFEKIRNILETNKEGVMDRVLRRKGDTKKDLVNFINNELKDGESFKGGGLQDIFLGKEIKTILGEGKDTIIYYYLNYAKLQFLHKVYEYFKNTAYEGYKFKLHLYFDKGINEKLSKKIERYLKEAILILKNQNKYYKIDIKKNIETQIKVVELGSERYSYNQEIDEGLKLTLGKLEIISITEPYDILERRLYHL